MSEKRLIFVNRVYWPSTSATAQLLTDLAEGLAAGGWDVHVISAGEASTRHNGVTIHRTGTPERHGGLLSRALNHRSFLRTTRHQLKGLLKADDIVVALTDPPMLGSLVAETAAGPGARVIHWIQDIYPEIAGVHFGALAGFFLSSLKRRRDRAWQAAATCVTLGEDMAAFVTGRGVDARRLQTFPNWAPRELHAPAAAPAIAERRNQWGCAGKFVVAYSGNLGRVHEFATILEAATELRADASIVFLFIGQGPRFAEVAAIVQQRNLGNVRLLPPEPRATLPASLAAADAHFVTLRPEYGQLVYPSKLAGVLAAGRPVLFIGPPEGDIGRLLRVRDCGAAFAPGQAKELAATIKRWHQEPDHSATLGVHAREAYARAFSSGEALTRWDVLLRTMPAAITSVASAESRPVNRHE